MTINSAHGVKINKRCDMEQYVIKGGNPLVGEVEIEGISMYCLKRSLVLEHR